MDGKDDQTTGIIEDYSDTLQKIEQVWDMYSNKTKRHETNKLKQLDWFEEMYNQPIKYDNVKVVFYGELYLFNYMAETTQEYDRQPLVISIFPKDREGFHGINLHYVAPRLRAFYLYNFIKNEIENKTSIRTNPPTVKRIKRWDMLRTYKHCIKHYKYERVRGSLKQLPKEYWPFVPFLPFERFINVAKTKVWLEGSKKQE